jgi:orotate phosphoribosyltransferase
MLQEKTKMAEGVLELFSACEALMEGHFLLSSGLHSNRYLQCAKVLQQPGYAERLGREIAAQWSDTPVDVVVGPALGGIVIAHEVARALGVRGMFAERQDGAMTLRRGFSVARGERALIAENVITTGGSVAEVAEMLRACGAQPVGIGTIIDRSAGAAQVPVPYRALLTLDIQSYAPDACPLCAQGMALVKPGSKGIA